MRKLIIAIFISLIAISLFVNVAQATETVIFDDQEPNYWQFGISGVYSEDYIDKAHGTLSGKLTVGNDVEYCFHHFSSDQNWAGYEGLKVWWHGNSSSDLITLRLYNQAMDAYFYDSFTDNFDDWRELSFDFTGMTLAGLMSWNQIRYVSFESLAVNNTWQIDYLYLYSYSTVAVTTTEQDVNWMAFIVLIAFTILNILLMLIARIPILNIVLAILTLGLAAATANDSTLPIQPYFSLIVALVSMLGMLRAAELLRNN